MPLAAGTRLGPYEIQTPLGSGGMGKLYWGRVLEIIDTFCAVGVLRLDGDPVRD